MFVRGVCFLCPLSFAATHYYLQHCRPSSALMLLDTAVASGTRAPVKSGRQKTGLAGGCCAMMTCVTAGALLSLPASPFTNLSHDDNSLRERSFCESSSDLDLATCAATASNITQEPWITSSLHHKGNHHYSDKEKVRRGIMAPKKRPRLLGEQWLAHPRTPSGSPRRSKSFSTGPKVARRRVATFGYLYGMDCRRNNEKNGLERQFLAALVTTYYSTPL